MPVDARSATVMETVQYGCEYSKKCCKDCAASYVNFSYFN